MFRCDVCNELEEEYEDALWCEYCQEEYYACNNCSGKNSLYGRMKIHEIKHKSVDLV